MHKPLPWQQLPLPTAERPSILSRGHRSARFVTRQAQVLKHIGPLRETTKIKAAAAEEGIESVQVQAEGSSTSRARLLSFEDGVYTVEGTAYTSASTSQVWDVLTDYERLSDIFSNIKESRMLSREPEIILHQCTNVTQPPKCALQDCKWEFLVFSGSFCTELSVKEDWRSMVLTFQLIQSSFTHSFVGEWQLKPHQGGSKIRHKLAVEPVASPPAFMTGYTQNIFVQQVASILRDLEEEMERRNSEDFSYHDL